MRFVLVLLLMGAWASITLTSAKKGRDGSGRLSSQRAKVRAPEAPPLSLSRSQIGRVSRSPKTPIGTTARPQVSTRAWKPAPTLFSRFTQGLPVTSRVS